MAPLSLDFPTAQSMVAVSVELVLSELLCNALIVYQCGMRIKSPRLCYPNSNVLADLCSYLAGLG